jgi:hypothetical protein
MIINEVPGKTMPAWIVIMPKDVQKKVVSAKTIEKDKLINN